MAHLDLVMFTYLYPDTKHTHTSIPSLPQSAALTFISRIYLFSCYMVIICKSGEGIQINLKDKRQAAVMRKQAVLRLSGDLPHH
jgi:hypothetical protein